MLKFSSSYIGEQRNFIITNRKDNYESKLNYSIKNSILSVIQNIIQRGTPTKPSKYLISKLGEPVCIQNDEIILLNNEKMQWSKTIKGDNTTGYCPAEKFYYDLIPEYLPDYKFIQNLILPEANFNEIINEEENSFKNSQVDFYLAEANLVIEIDGIQHNEIIQKTKDNARDSVLVKNDIETIRINTKDIQEHGDELSSKMNLIKSILEDSNAIEKYKNEHNNKHDVLYKNYEMCIRFQILILDILKNEKLLENDKFNVFIRSNEEMLKCYLI